MKSDNFSHLKFTLSFPKKWCAKLMSRRRRHQLAQELSEVLKRRFSYETHLDRYKRIYKVLINEIAEELHAEEETILHAP